MEQEKLITEMLTNQMSDFKNELDKKVVEALNKVIRQEVIKVLKEHKLIE